MFEENLEKIAPYNGPLPFLLRRIKRAARPIRFEKIQRARLVFGVAADISAESDVIVLEDDLELIFDALHTKQWSAWLQRPGTHLVFLSPHNSGLFERVILFTLRGEFTLAATSQKEEGSLFDHALATRIDLLSYFSDFRDYGAKVIGHIIQNCSRWRSLHPITHLPFKGQPVCIVGAGPSLEEDIERIRQMKERAWVVSGGSALPFLLEYDLLPDFVIIVDSEKGQLKRSDYYADLNIPTLIAPRALPEAVEKVQGPQIHLSFEHPLLQRFEKAAGIETETLDLGWSLVTAAVSVAKEASHIILFGVDLAFQGDRGYASSAFESPGDDRCILPSKNGGGVSSLSKWRLERDFLSRLAHEATYNAGAYGIEIPGWKNEVPLLPKLSKNFELPAAIETESFDIAFEQERSYLVNYIWDRMRYMALDFEALMSGGSANESLKEIICQEIEAVIEKEFSRVAVG